MVVTSRQLWIAVGVAAFGLGGGCASQLPDGELACGGEAAHSRCPSEVPVCERRPGDAAAYCYRAARVHGALAPRFGERSTDAVTPRVRMPASRNFRLTEQSVARADGTMLAAGH